MVFSECDDDPSPSPQSRSPPESRSGSQREEEEGQEVQEEAEEVVVGEEGDKNAECDANDRDDCDNEHVEETLDDGARDQVEKEEETASHDIKTMKGKKPSSFPLGYFRWPPPEGERIKQRFGISTQWAWGLFIYLYVTSFFFYSPSDLMTLFGRDGRVLVVGIFGKGDFWRRDGMGGGGGGVAECSKEGLVDTVLQRDVFWIAAEEEGGGDRDPAEVRHEGGGETFFLLLQ